MMDGKGYNLLGGTLLTAALAIVLLLVSQRQAAIPEDALVIVAKDMRFMVMDQAGIDQPNPTLRFSAGQSVTIEFRNEDAGMKHDLVLEGLNVRSRVLSLGESQRLRVTIPANSDQGAYLCSLHPRTMRGRLLFDDYSVAASPSGSPIVDRKNEF